MKKRILAISLVVAMLAIAVIGGSLAYFTDTDQVKNTFTAGNVKIKMDEAKVDEYGNPVEDAGRVQANTYKLVPGLEYTKDPTITVLEGSEDTYLAAVITVNKNLTELIPLEGKNGYVDINKMISGGIMAPASPATEGYGNLDFVFENEIMGIYQKPIWRGDNTASGHIFYVFFKNPYAAGESVTLFDTLTVPAKATAAQIKTLEGMEIKINAYAAQAASFDSCYEAVTTAFPGVFAK